MARLAIGATKTLILYADDELRRRLPGDITFSVRREGGRLLIVAQSTDTPTQGRFAAHFRPQGGNWVVAVVRSRVQGLTDDVVFGKTEAAEVRTTSPHRVEFLMPADLRSAVQRRPHTRQRPVVAEPCLRDLVRMVNAHAASDEGLSLSVRDNRLVATVMVEYT